MEPKNPNRQTLVPGSADIKSARAPKTFQRPPKIPLPVNPEPKTSSPRKREHSLKHESPWGRYWRVWEKDQAGRGVLACENVPTYPVVFIKTREAPDLSKAINHLKKAGHGNVVQLKEFMLADACIFFVYEAMKVSIAQIRGSPYVEFNEADIATVCKEV